MRLPTATVKATDICNDFPQQDRRSQILDIFMPIEPVSIGHQQPSYFIEVFVIIAI